MIYLNNFIPIRVYFSTSLNVYRLLAPYADRSNLEYNEEFVRTKLTPTYELIDTIYVLNPRLFPPVPLGAVMFSVYQNDEPPYNTKYIEWIAFPVMTNVFHEVGNFSFYAFINSPFKGAKPMYIRNEKNYTMISLDEKQIADYFLTTPYYRKALDRDNYVIYIFKKPHLYWRATTECLCVPSDNPIDYQTLVECQRNTYHKIRNKNSYTGNSAIPLSEMRDKLYPTPSKNYFYQYFLCFLIVVYFLYIFKQKRAEWKQALVGLIYGKPHSSVVGTEQQRKI